MTAAVVLLAVCQVAVVAFLAFDRLRERRHPDLEALIALTDRLCQRIQSPHTAILEHDEQVRARSPEYAPPAVNPELDDDYWDSKDDMAERMMQNELDGNS